jgi:hypothetical protein
MHRCVLSWPALALAATLALPAAAQVARSFPADALRGTLEVRQPPEILLNGQPARLSPGARIQDAQRMQQLSGRLVGQKLLVNYTLEPLGGVHRVWILDATEAARQPWPRTLDEARRWSFDAAAQTWTVR